MKHLTIRVLAVLLAILTLCVGFASCAKENEVAGDVRYENAEPSEKAPTAGGVGNGFLATDHELPSTDSTTTESAVTDRKIIKTFVMDAETTEFEQATAALNALVAEYGAYVENASVHDKSLTNQNRYARTATYTVRVPAEQADAFTNALGGHFNVTYKTETVKDISDTYYSIEARLEELVVERDSLLDILDAPETKKDYELWLKVHQRISEVTQQIAVYQGNLERYDNQVAYSTVRVSLREVIQYTPQNEGNGFFARWGTAFRKGWTNFVDGLQDFAIWFAESLPTLILLAAIAIGLFFAIRVIIRRCKAKKCAKKMKAEPQAEPEQKDEE